ncbi:hypothetical protein MR657_09820, partial [bacterium]|nr:hypothetical protein [bacterium]
GQKISPFQIHGRVLPLAMSFAIMPQPQPDCKPFLNIYSSFWNIYSICAGHKTSPPASDQDFRGGRAGCYEKGFGIIS